MLGPLRVQNTFTNSMSEYSYLEDWSPVVVRWRDAHRATESWVDIHSYVASECVITTYGHIWKDCLEGHLTLAGSVDGDKDIAGDVNHIPLGMVLEIRRLDA
jgi:hypothetical protein